MNGMESCGPRGIFEMQYRWIVLQIPVKLQEFSVGLFYVASVNSEVITQAQTRVLLQNVSRKPGWGFIATIECMYFFVVPASANLIKCGPTWYFDTYRKGKKMKTIISNCCCYYDNEQDNRDFSYFPKNIYLEFFPYFFLVLRLNKAQVVLIS